MPTSKRVIAQTFLPDENPRGRSVEVAHLPTQVEGEGAIPIRPHLVRAAGPSKGICDAITNRWHSYVKITEQRGGRALDYLIYGEWNGKKTLVGTIGFAFLGLRIPSPITTAFSAYQVRSNNPYSLIKGRRIAACYRYTLMTGVPNNFASRALAVSLRLLKADWFQKYESDLLGVVTFVKPPWTGVCFKAANFKLVGVTSGKPITYSLHHHKDNAFKDVQLYILVYRYSKVQDPPQPSSTVDKVHDHLEAFLDP